MSTLNNPAKLDAHAIDLITQLALESSQAQIIHIPTEGLGPGLPPTVPTAYDAKTGRVVMIKDQIENFRTAPARRKGTAIAGTLASFIALVNRHKDAQSALFGATSWPEPKLTAVLDYDSAEAPARFGQHRVVYEFPLTEEFKAWVDGDSKQMNQTAFAIFLEDHAAELAAPDAYEKETYEALFKESFATPSEVLELSRYLEVYVAAKAKQGVRLQTGERVVEFAEEHQNASGGKVTIPGIFMVSVPAFVDGNVVRIPARLRYRLANGSVNWFYQLYRWESFLRETVEAALNQAADETALPAFDGAPETGKGG